MMTIHYFKKIMIATMLCACGQSFARGEKPEHEGTMRHFPRAIVLSTQAQVNTFHQSDVNGDLIIYGKNISSINLPSLRSVKGSLRIVRNPLLTVISLPSLQTIGNPLTGGDIVIEHNPSLEEIRNLSQLTTIHGLLEISYNGKLTTLNGLTALKSLEALKIAGNDALEKLQPFDALTALKPVSRFGRPPGEVLVIKGNNSLLNLNFLSSLSEVKGHIITRIYIGYNKSLSNIDGLKNLTTVGSRISFLEISNNQSLRNIDGLSSIVNIDSKAHITIAHNRNLTRCCGLYNIINLVRSNFISIRGNGGGCTLSEIKSGGPCPAPGDCLFVTLTSQSEVDNFRRDRGCTTVGNLQISGADITNLNGLSDITTILSSINIVDNPVLTDIRGLQSINLMDPDFPNIGGLEVRNNPLLPNLNGLQSLTSLTGTVLIRNNANLADIDGLSSVQIIWGDLTIADNPKLKNLHGLKSLKQVAPGRYWSKFSILNNDALENLDGLESFEKMEGYHVNFEIIDNDALINIDGLSGLKVLNGVMEGTELEISQNDKLQNLDGLSSLVVERSFLDLKVTQNPQLNACCGVANLLLNTASISVLISGNGTSCTYEEIIDEDGPCFSTTTTLAIEDVLVYPNPNHGQFEVLVNPANDDTYQVVVIDFFGNVVKKSIVTANTAALIDIRPVRTGLYMLRIYRDGNLITSRRLSIRD